MSKFLAKRHKFQSTKEVDVRRRKAEIKAGVHEPESFGLENLRLSTPRMREYFVGGDFYDARRGYTFITEPGIAAAQRRPDTLDYIGLLNPDPRNFRTGFEGFFVMEPGIAAARRDFIEEGVGVSGEFLGNHPVCPACGRRHDPDWAYATIRDIWALVDRNMNEHIRDLDAIPGEAVRVQEHNLLPHHKDLK